MSIASNRSDSVAVVGVGTDEGALRANARELPEMAAFCRARTKDYYRFDPLLHLRFDGDQRRNDIRLDHRSIGSARPDDHLAAGQSHLSHDGGLQVLRHPVRRDLRLLARWCRLRHLRCLRRWCPLVHLLRSAPSPVRRGMTLSNALRWAISSMRQMASSGRAQTGSTLLPESPRTSAHSTVYGASPAEFLHSSLVLIRQQRSLGRFHRQLATSHHCFPYSLGLIWLSQTGGCLD